MPSFDLFSGSVSQDEDSWTWQFTIDVDYADWLALKPSNGIYPEITLTVRGQSFSLLVEGASRSLTDVNHKFSLSGRGLSAKLDGHHAVGVDKSWRDTSAQAIVAELCGLAGVGLDYAVLDFPVREMDGQGRYPIEIINELMQAIGAVMQTLQNGTLQIRSRYVCNPNQYFEQTAAFTLTDLDDYETADERWDDRHNYNVISVGDAELNDERDQQLSILSKENKDDEGELINADKIVQIYCVPFIDSITLEDSADGALALLYEGVTQETIEETIEIVEGNGSLSKPCYGNIVAAYIHADLGQVTVEHESTDVKTDIESLSLMSISYTTQYHQYRAQRNSLDEQLQIYAEVVDENNS